MKEKFSFQLSNKISRGGTTGITYHAILKDGVYLVTHKENVRLVIYNKSEVESAIKDGYWIIIKDE